MLLLGCSPNGGKPTPTPSPTPDDPVRVFVSSQTYNGNLQVAAGGPEGGLAGDAICQSLADAAGLGGTWVAWLSDDDFDAATRLQAAGGHGPWFLGPDTGSGPQVFANREATSGAPAVPIDVTEQGNTVGSGLVWTGTKAGGAAAAPNCGNWTDDTTDLAVHDVYGRSGALARSDDAWTDAIDSSCLEGHHLYCLEI